MSETLSKRLHDARGPTVDILGTYLIVGPLIGFAAYCVTAILASLIRGESSISYSWVLLVLLAGPLFAYLGAAVYAVLTGVLVSLGRLWFHRVTLSVAVAAALLAAYPGTAGALFPTGAAIAYGLFGHDVPRGSLAELVLNAAIGVVASVGCWLLLRWRGLAE